MKLITWNIQWGLGVDGRVDLARIVDTARAMADFDVLCLQEVSRNYPALRGSDGADQFAQLATLLPDYHAMEGIAVDRYTPGIGRKPIDRQQFGNMILSRFAPLQIFRHALPWSGEPAAPTMPRLALEAVLQMPSGPCRVTTTHLEYYSARHRAAQVEALRAVQADAASHARNQPHPQEKAGGPFEMRPRGARGILTGDFNCAPSDAAIAQLQAPVADGVLAYADAWTAAHPGTAHAPTVGRYDKVQWKDGERCFDFIFVTADITQQVRRVEVNQDTEASDHQPVLLEIDL